MPFNVTLKELKTKELLPLDDDFVKDISEFDTLDELKADIEVKWSVKPRQYKLAH